MDEGCLTDHTCTIWLWQKKKDKGNKQRKLAHNDSRKPRDSGLQWLRMTQNGPKTEVAVVEVAAEVVVV